MRLVINLRNFRTMSGAYCISRMQAFAGRQWDRRAAGLRSPSCATASPNGDVICAIRRHVRGNPVCNFIDSFTEDTPFRMSIRACSNLRMTLSLLVDSRNELTAGGHGLLSDRTQGGSRLHKTMSAG